MSVGKKTTDPMTGFRRTVLVVFPASFAARVFAGLGGDRGR